MYLLNLLPIASRKFSVVFMTYGRRYRKEYFLPMFERYWPYPKENLITIKQNFTTQFNGIVKYLQCWS